MISKQKRPKFLNLLQIHLPVAGVNSIAHRISGALLFLAIPLLIYLFNLSLRDADGYQKVMDITGSLSGKLVLSLLVWASAHHLLAGIRFLLIDLDIGMDLVPARNSAWFVNVAGIVIFIFIAYKIWL